GGGGRSAGGRGGPPAAGGGEGPPPRPCPPAPCQPPPTARSRWSIPRPAGDAPSSAAGHRREPPMWAVSDAPVHVTETIQSEGVLGVVLADGSARKAAAPVDCRPAQSGTCLLGPCWRAGLSASCEA